MQALLTNLKDFGENDSVARKMLSKICPHTEPNPLPEAPNAQNTPADQNRGMTVETQAKNLILQGPPGTGKTYLAYRKIDRYADGIIRGKLKLSNIDIEKAFGDPDSEESQLLDDAPVIWDIVQFHPSYTYEDFVLGIRPSINESGHVVFRAVPGIFLKMCLIAERREEKPTVLVIDEINRADLSKVFGELIHLLEYRGEGIASPLSYEDLDGIIRSAIVVPENLEIIGTMNTADRSIAFVDFAIRRRFYFEDVWPDEDPIRRQHLDGALQAFRYCRKLIADTALQIGHSYFLARSREALVEKLKRQVLPLLWEYQREGLIEGEGLPPRIANEKYLDGFVKGMMETFDEEDVVGDDHGGGATAGEE